MPLQTIINWIETSERLPELRKRVQVLTEYREISTARRMSEPSENPAFNFIWDEPAYSRLATRKFEHVTHWAPMPTFEVTP